MKEIDPTSVAIFQGGELQAFGKLLTYEENTDTFNTQIKIEKGTLKTGEFLCNIVREYDVCKEGTFYGN